MLDHEQMGAVIRDQTPHAQLILEAVVRFEASGDPPVRSKIILRMYEQVADHGGTDRLSVKSVLWW